MTLRDAPTMFTFIVSDDRERDVAPFLADGDDPWAPAGWRPCPVVTRRVTTGDFHVCARDARGTRVLACVERKTLPDFAASFKDGRYENVEKMLALRASTGCALMFFVEGPAFPSPGRKIGRIPYVNIRAAVDALCAQGISTVLTEDPADTAARLRGIARAYSRVAEAAPPAGEAAPLAVPAAAPAAEAEEVAETAEAAPAAPAAGGGGVEDLEVPAELTAANHASPRAAATAVWSALPGVSVVTGRVLVDAFSLAELATGAVGPEQLEALRLPSGRALGAEALRSLNAIRTGNAALAAKAVAEVRGVSAALARALVGDSLAALCRRPAAFLADARVPHGAKTQRLGEARAARVREALWYGPRGPPADDGHRLG